MSTMPIEVGMVFADSKQALHYVQDYALNMGKQAKVMAKSGGGHKRMICSCPSCPFFVQMYQQKKTADNQKNRQWYVSSCDLTHSLHCTSTAKPTCRQLIEMQAMQHAVHTNTKISANALITSLPSLNLKRLQRTVYRAKREILTRAPEDMPEDADRLQPMDSLLPAKLPPPINPNLVPPKKRKETDKELVEIERARLEIKRRKEERLEKESQVQYRILLAKAQEAEIAVKVARAKARQELLNSGISLEEADHILL